MNRYLLVACLILFPLGSYAQKKKKKSTTVSYDQKLYSAVKWRNIGPFRGGRSAAVTGVSSDPTLFYMGTTGGGVWKTENGGSSWKNISDGYFGGSIGAVEVNASDPNVIYVGEGEVTVRGNVSSGNGMWRSTDAGESWTYLGLENSRHIPRVRTHPNDPDLVYVAVLGDLYKSSEDRGLYRSNDGGKNWEKILYANEDAGVVDLIIDPNNPRIIYASTWKIRRTPYSLSSGGEGCALYKSKDGGDTWEEISKNKGFAKSTLGIIGITVSPKNSQRLWALVEAEDGGLYRSENGGKSWFLVNKERDLRQRAWYYTRVHADTEDEDKVHVLNVRYMQSKDGGKTFKKYRTPHGDHHDLWIDPNDAQRIIIGDDGGGQVSYDGGLNWSTYMNQPTAQFYRVVTDNHFPYRIYGGQQDNSTVRIDHRSSGAFVDEDNWEETAGGESAQLAIESNNEMVYGSSYMGFLMSVDHRSEEYRFINVWPWMPAGHGVEDMKYRFQWNFPVFISPHDDNKLYVASNMLHLSEDKGESWKVVSPDLTRDDKTKQVSSGGPITQDNTGVEYYCTIFAAQESPHEEGVIYTGSDDGLLHITKNGGQDWKNITPPDMPEWSLINSIEIDPHENGGIYVVATRYKSGDYQPYLYRSKDYGETWQSIVNGIADEDFTRALRADPVRKGLLYLGTENGMYLSFDDGDSWNSFQLNLPIVPITDLAIKDDNLIAATQGRSFWLIDDLGPLRQVNDEIADKDFHLYSPKDSYITSGYYAGKSLKAGENHPNGVMLYTYFKNKPDSADVISLSIKDAEGNEIRRFHEKAKEKRNKWTAKDSTQLMVWDMHYEDPVLIDNLYEFFMNKRGPVALPGDYTAVLRLNEDSIEVPFKMIIDPRVSSSQEDLKMQFEFVKESNEILSEMHQSIVDIRKVRKELNALNNKLQDEEFEDLLSESHRIDSLMLDVESSFYQIKNKSEQDILNYPIMLNNKIGMLSSFASAGYYRPTQQMYDLLEEIKIEMEPYSSTWEELKNSAIPELNKNVKESSIDAISIPE